MTQYKVGLNNTGKWQVVAVWEIAQIAFPFEFGSLREAQKIADEKNGVVDSIREPERFAREWEAFWQ